jgi:hypothetical protein
MRPAGSPAPKRVHSPPPPLRACLGAGRLTGLPGAVRHDIRCRDEHAAGDTKFFEAGVMRVPGRSAAGAQGSGLAASACAQQSQPAVSAIL